MLQIFSVTKAIDFLKHAKVISLLSVVLVVGSLLSLGVKGINWGLDFTGGFVVGREVSPLVDFV